MLNGGYSKSSIDKEVEKMECNILIVHQERWGNVNRYVLDDIYNWKQFTSAEYAAKYISENSERSRGVGWRKKTETFLDENYKLKKREKEFELFSFQNHPPDSTYESLR